MQQTVRVQGRALSASLGLHAPHQGANVTTSFDGDVAAGSCKFDQGRGFPCFAEVSATVLVDIKIHTEHVDVGVDE